MLNLIIGIAVGAAFSPFWIKLFGALKVLATSLIAKFKK